LGVLERVTDGGRPYGKESRVVRLFLASCRAAKQISLKIRGHRSFSPDYEV
jgi:hypothetical protein